MRREVGRNRQQVRAVGVQNRDRVARTRHQQVREASQWGKPRVAVQKRLVMPLYIAPAKPISRKLDLIAERALAPNLGASFADAPDFSPKLLSRYGYCMVQEGLQRQAVIEDPVGFVWFVATQIRTATRAQIQQEFDAQQAS